MKRSGFSGPPRTLNEAGVLYYSYIDERHRPTGNTTHYNGNTVLGPFAIIAICKYGDDNGFYLFYCDDHWEVLTDTFHESLEDAMEQAEFEFQGISEAWIRIVDS